jgi:hypothetical protein
MVFTANFPDEKVVKYKNSKYLTFNYLVNYFSGAYIFLQHPVLRHPNRLNIHKLVYPKHSQLAPVA